MAWPGLASYWPGLASYWPGLASHIVSDFLLYPYPEAVRQDDLAHAAFYSVCHK